MGYHFAGHEVVGVDIKPQPRYPFKFMQWDALDYLERNGRFSSDFIHASPPCQAYSDLARRNTGGDWPRLIEPVRAALQETGLPYIIENVEGAPLHDPVVLCGTMFAGLRVIRHRLFETNVKLAPPPVHGRHPLVFTHDKRKAHYGVLDQDVSFIQVTGGGNATLANKRDAMGMPWAATHHEVNEAIPPAYTQWIGAQL